MHRWVTERINIKEKKDLPRCQIFEQESLFFCFNFCVFFAVVVVALYAMAISTIIMAKRRNRMNMPRTSYF